MKAISNFMFLIILMNFSGCENQDANSYSLEIEQINLKLNNNLRGLSVVDSSNVWASGTQGVFLKTADGGDHWKVDSIEGAGMLDFRSVHAFDYARAIVVSAGTPARIYKTRDGGDNWELSFSSSDPAIFLNAIAFWNDSVGVVMGDPVDGNLVLLKTIDGGESWDIISPEAIPPSLLSEGGFAASGTCMVAAGNEFAWVGVGGDSARVYRTIDQGQSWSVHNTPMLCGSQMKGIYSLAFKDEQNGIAVGGEWNVITPLKSRAFTVDGGVSWDLGAGVDSYCSGSCWVKDDIFLACGQRGIDISIDCGRNWKNISNRHLYGIQFDDSGKVGYGSGPSGKLVRLRLLEK